MARVVYCVDYFRDPLDKYIDLENMWEICSPHFSWSIRANLFTGSTRLCNLSLNQNQYIFKFFTSLHLAILGLEEKKKPNAHTSL